MSGYDFGLIKPMTKTPSQELAERLTNPMDSVNGLLKASVRDIILYPQTDRERDFINLLLAEFSSIEEINESELEAEISSLQEDVRDECCRADTAEEDFSDSLTTIKQHEHTISKQGKENRDLKDGYRIIDQFLIDQRDNEIIRLQEKVKGSVEVIVSMRKRLSDLLDMSDSMAQSLGEAHKKRVRVIRVPMNDHNDNEVVVRFIKNRKIRVRKDFNSNLDDPDAIPEDWERELESFKNFNDLVRQAVEHGNVK